MRTFEGKALHDDFQTQLAAASSFPWENIRISHWVFLESRMFDKKDMVDSAMKPRRLTLTDKTLQDQPRLERDDRSIREGTWFTMAACAQDLAS